MWQNSGRCTIFLLGDLKGRLLEVSSVTTVRFRDNRGRLVGMRQYHDHLDCPISPQWISFCGDCESSGVWDLDRYGRRAGCLRFCSCRVYSTNSWHFLAYQTVSSTQESSVHSINWKAVWTTSLNTCSHHVCIQIKGIRTTILNSTYQYIASKWQVWEAFVTYNKTYAGVYLLYHSRNVIKELL